ncbi:UDP-N-acetylmuramoyl-tripeptide--D-alanyl-D-alanine ligase [Salegentibacter sp. F188]|uniref:UDP-N-acetylmuramoyl-tripeptide--D-alanyl-D-alanine ligase n=1 Tax=Autumnicola patrickiae TaxID=3075591 RepID=A0ABU3E1T7_9FLAO|nr:UDP-N-acetylmuramoyl-tripeptide--D-alanyl-D-alanine ligase [Salegentibacter sp. F188]MDT0689232.1 UDP-N-acetylmuramoyl-tripeptide--D-alanyl-D-alanine ligase [Salegentibacter sp. F188]
MNVAQIHQHFLISSGACIDTRILKEGCIFFALSGPNFNGNQFAREALDKGAKMAIVDEEIYAADSRNFIVVKDVLKTLQELAKFHRQYLDLPIIAITGSNGKTTTKELVNTVLSRKYKTVATKGNLNNHIGVPLTLLSMDAETQMGIVEMGANHLKEIEVLSEIALPDYGYITNFGKAHLEGFGNVEGVIAAKSELYTNIKKNKRLLFLNTNDPIQRNHLDYKHTFTFGTTKDAQLELSYSDNQSYASVNYNDTVFQSKITGKHNAQNIAAAICIGLYFKVPFDQVKEAISEYIPSNNRSEVTKKESNTIFMDAYNANPNSMQAALSNFDELSTSEPKIVILGDMLELGTSSEEEHQEIVAILEKGSFTECYLLGENFNRTKTNKSTIIKFKSNENLKKHLEETEFKNCHILIKGSRGMALEKMQEAI